MLLYMIRHGETVWNSMGRLQGREDISLNENGIRLAKITGEQLKDVPFDLAISSPLQRAYVTAELVLGGRDIPIYTDERIQEICFGIWEGEAFMKSDPSHPFYAFFSDAYHYMPPKNGESIFEVIERTKEFYEELISRPELQDKTILIATHGCALRGILHNVYEDTSDFWHGGVCPNCGDNIVEVKDGKSTLLADDKIYY